MQLINLNMFRAASLILRRAGTAGRIEHRAEAAQLSSMLVLPQRCMSKGGFFKSFYENLKQDLERYVRLDSKAWNNRSRNLL